MELVARGDGVLRKVLSAEGVTVEVGKLVAVIGAPDEDISALAGNTGSGKREAGSVRPAGVPVPDAGSGKREAGSGRNPPPPSVVAVEQGGRVKASPLARRMANEKGVDLGEVSGSGPGGRIVKRDLEGAAASRFPVPASPLSTASAGGFRDVPLTQIRKTIAKRLSQSLAPVPHFFLTTEIDMERAWDAREALNQLDTGHRVSFNDIMVKFVALALTRHPDCNAWWMDDRIRYFGDVHIGMAVAVEDGLITPVIRNAHTKGLREIAAESKDLAERARSRKLKPDEYTGSTFSLSNLGMFDIDQFTAIINPPEAGILAVGSIVQQPVVHGGQVVPRRRMRVTMSCDHRVIDGATGARFLQTLKQTLENPLTMVL
jgi:pyruvate dehydrogenase E2 component (dihydrolipoamide acetyltransferase)